jgi:hypothetical protein
MFHTGMKGNADSSGRHIVYRWRAFRLYASLASDALIIIATLVTLRRVRSLFVACRYVLSLIEQCCSSLRTYI